MIAWGVVLILIGGILGGTYFLGLKWTGPWEWENIWLVCALVGLIVVPVLLSWATVPHLNAALSMAPAEALVKVFLYGAGWGVGSVLTGLGVDRLGMALGVPVLVGSTAALGALIPLAAATPGLVFHAKGLVILVSVGVLLVGLSLIGIAGRAREATRPSHNKHGQKDRFVVGLLICIFGGVFACMLNLAFSFSKPVARATALAGARRGGAQNFVWMVALAGGFLANAAFTGFLLVRNRTWKKFFLPRSSRAALVGTAMAVLWYAGAVFYGRGATMMGELGAVVGWPIFISALILFSTLWGFVMGEWEGAGARAGPGRVGLPAKREAALHRAGQAHPESFHRDVGRQMCVRVKLNGLLVISGTKLRQS